MLYLVISIFLFVPYLVLLMYYRFGWKSISQENFSNDNSQVLPFISVIVPARNEEKNIALCLEGLAEQDYTEGSYEIIVIDDHSEDATAEIVNSFSKNTTHIRLIRLADFIEGGKMNSFKKKSIALAIEFAKGDLIVTTDADCIAPETWLSAIGKCFVHLQPAMISGPVRFSIPPTGNFLQKFFYIFQALDFITLQGITAAAIQKKLHYMANGANLAYSKKIFESINGFEGIDNIASGDDIMLMEKIGFSEKILYLKNRDAIVTTKPEPTLRTFLNQRIRWAGKSSAYSDKKIKWIMALVYLVNAWLVILAVSLVFNQEILLYLLIFFSVKLIVDLLFLFPVSAFFRQRNLLWCFVLMEPVHILYVSFAGWLGAFGSYSWKGRKVK